MFCGGKIVGAGIHVEAVWYAPPFPNTAADQVGPLTAKALPYIDPSGRICHHITQEWCEDRDKQHRPGLQIPPDPNQIHRSLTPKPWCQIPQDTPEVLCPIYLGWDTWPLVVSCWCQAIVTPWAHVRPCCSVLMRRVAAIRDCHCHEGVFLHTNSSRF